MTLLKRWLQPETRSRRLIVAVAIYILCSTAYALVAGPDRLREHSSGNHYALLADAWLHGHQDLTNGAPVYTGNNDFAYYDGKTFISFPPFPAVLMLPFVAIAGSAENFQDGQFIVWLAGLGPALLFIVLEKLRRTSRSRRSEAQNAALATLFAFGTVYFFTAVQGTVWYAAHVVGVALVALYVLFSLDCERPWLAGLAFACAWMTRPTLLLTCPLFAFEALRVCGKDEFFLADGIRAHLQRVRDDFDWKRLLRMGAMFSVPVILSLGISSWSNFTRFHDPSPFGFGHTLLAIVWRGRVEKFGLFGYHYLSKNLGVMLTILPWLPAKIGRAIGEAPFRINEHGLALWFTTPLYFWLLHPKSGGVLYKVVALSAALPLVMDLLYQNSGWLQFGYRFSNDYSILLFVLLAIGDRPMKKLFSCAAVWSVAWNLFGAITFDRYEYRRYYFREGTQSVLYQPD